jgi:hypothetical protein
MKESVLSLGNVIILHVKHAFPDFTNAQCVPRLKDAGYTYTNE